MVIESGWPLRAAFAVALGSLIACGNSVPVGQQAEPAGSDSKLSSGDDYCVGGDDYEPAVEWEGYIENSSVSSAEDRVRIRVPSGSDPGFVIFGSGPKLPVPKQPGATYPCADQVEWWLRAYPYTISKSDITARRMRFQIWMQEPFEPWCKLLKGKGIADDPYPANCQDNIQCSFCQCDDDGCRALYSQNPVYGPTDGQYAQFDITLEGETADGTVQGLTPDISSAQGGPVERVRLFAVEAD